MKSECDCQECLDCLRRALQRYGKHDLTCASVATYTSEGAWDRPEGGTGRACSCGLARYLEAARREHKDPSEHAPWCAVTKMLRATLLSRGTQFRIGGQGSCGSGAVCDCGVNRVQLK